MGTSTSYREELELVLRREVERTEKLYRTEDRIRRTANRRHYLRALQRFARLVEDGQLQEDTTSLNKLS